MKKVKTGDRICKYINQHGIIELSELEEELQITQVGIIYHLKKLLKAKKIKRISKRTFALSSISDSEADLFLERKKGETIVTPDLPKRFMSFLWGCFDQYFEIGVYDKVVFSRYFPSLDYDSIGKSLEDLKLNGLKALSEIQIEPEMCIFKTDIRVRPFFKKINLSSLYFRYLFDEKERAEFYMPDSFGQIGNFDFSLQNMLMQGGEAREVDSQ